MAESAEGAVEGRGSLNALRRSDHAIGFGLAVVHLVLLLQAAPQVGIPRDESFYFDAADNAAVWVDGLFDSEIESFSRKEIDRGFKYNHEHPVLMKMLFGVSHRVFHDKLEWIADHRTAYRLPTLVMGALAVWLAYLLGVLIGGRGVGVVAACALALMPRVFFHSTLACFDGPVTFMWLLIVYTFVRATRSRRWAIASGIAVGLGFATKLNIFFVPFTLLGVAAIEAWTFKRRTGAWRAPAGQRGPLTYYSWIAVSMVVLGGVVFFGHWPWLYYDTFERLSFYLSFHAKHVHYPVDYLGTLQYKPPFPVHFPFVFSALSIPVPILILFGIGLGGVVRRAWRDWRTPQADDRQGLELTVLANLAVPFLVIALPFTPIFGGTKHWMPAMPFLAIIAGLGAKRLVNGLWPQAEATRRATYGAVLIGALFIAPCFYATKVAGTRGPTYFNALAGGLPGAVDLGMSRNFWGYSTIDVLPAINEQVEPRALVFWHKATSGAIQDYKRDGLLRKDVRYTGDWTAPYSNWAVYHDQQEKLWEELDIWRAYGTDWPVAGSFVDGVQIMSVYHRP